MLFKKNSQRRTRQRKNTVSAVEKPINDIPTSQVRRSSLNQGSAPKKTKSKPSRSLFKAFLSRIGVLVLIIILGFVLYRVTTLSTQTSVKVVPNDYQLLLRDPAVYQQTAEQYLSKSVLNRSKLTVNSTGLANEMLKKYPELAFAGLSLSVISNQPVLLIEAAPTALILSSSSGVYAIGYNGKALASTDEIPSVKSMRIPKVGDSSGLLIEPGQQALSSTHVNFIANVIKILGAKNIKVTSVNINNASSELDININSKPYIVKLNLQSNTPKEQVGTLIATLKQLQKENIEPSKYIDVRVSGRAYYQ